MWEGPRGRPRRRAARRQHSASFNPESACSLPPLTARREASGHYGELMVS